MKLKVLSTKLLEPDLIRAARKTGIDMVEQEFISIKPLFSKWKSCKVATLLNRFRIFTVVFTSANAVKAAESYVFRSDTYSVVACDIFCLSGKTKQAILQSKHLEKNIVGEADNAAGLAQKIIEKKVKDVIFFCGDKRRDELPDALRAGGVNVHEVVLYQTLPMPVVTEEIDAVLFFSPSAVQSFFSVNQLKENSVCFAIGETTAIAIREHTGNRIIVSNEPTQKAMMAHLQNYFQNKNFN